MLCVDLFDVALAWFERRKVDRGARLTDEDAEGKLEVGGLVPQAIDTPCVPRV